MQCNVLSRVLVSFVTQGVAEDVVHTALVRAFVGVEAAKAEVKTVPQPESLEDGIIMRHIPVKPSNISFWCLVPVVVVSEGVQEPWVLEVHTYTARILNKPYIRE